MKTLIITITDKAAEALEQAVAGGTHTVEQVASRVVEAAYASDWGDLDAEDIAAIEEGLDDLERGNVVSHEDIMTEARKKYGW